MTRVRMVPSVATRGSLEDEVNETIDEMEENGYELVDQELSEHGIGGNEPFSNTTVMLVFGDQEEEQ